MFYIILISGITIDLLTKQLALNYLQSRFNLISDFLYLQYVENPGIAFSIKVPSIILKSFTIILIIGIFYYYKGECRKVEEYKSRKDKILLDLSFGLILAGAIGNAIERIFNEKVIDFIGVKYFSVFNLADSFITIGAIILVYQVRK